MPKKTTWSQDVVSWEDGGDLHQSVVFTWHLARAERRATAWRAAHPGGRVVAGGPAVKLLGAPWADETPAATTVDVLAMHNPDATFTTRGCVRRCKFCAVPRIEGDFRVLPEWKRAPIVCDNNILAAPEAHFARVIASLRGLRGVDFNQGLDARLLTRWHAEQLATLGRSTVIRFALDHAASKDAVGRAVELVRGVGFRMVRVYVLIGFRDTLVDAVERLKFVRRLKAYTYPMRYQPLDARVKNAYVAPGWTEHDFIELQHYFFQRYRQILPLSEYRARRNLTRLRRNDTQFKRMMRRGKRRARQ